VGVRILALGIGNLLLKDEGAGCHAIKALRERFSFPGNVELIDGATMGLDLLPYIEGRDKLLLIDAVDFNSEPGTIKVMEGSDIKAFLDLKFSVHQIGVPDMLFAASFSGIAPPLISLVGIQPEKIEAGIELSDTLSGKFPELLDTIVEKLRHWGAEVKEKGHVPSDTV
jgi:hydrogenase maturation protease